MTIIYMTGSSGTGKTTLAQELCKRLGMIEAPSVARTSPYVMGTQLNQDYVMHNVDYQCRTASQAIVTRTPIDVYAYSFCWGLDFVEAAGVATRFLFNHPIVLYLPKYWEPEDDGFRPTEGQDEVDEAIFGALNNFAPLGFKYYEVKNESVQQRADNIILWLNERGLLQ